MRFVEGWRRLFSFGVATLLLFAMGIPSGVATAGGEVASTRVVVQLAAGADAVVVERSGGAVVEHLDALGLVVADVPTSRVDALAATDGVAHLALDRPVTLQATAPPQVPADQPNTALEVADAVGATAYWQAGATGQGVDVALIDTGVTLVPGLDEANVEHGIDLSTDGADPELAHLDAFGHGTAMAGLVVGRSTEAAGLVLDTGVDEGADTADEAATPFMGIAPDARVVSVKVGDATGEVDVSQVIAGLDWVVQNRTKDGRNIRVVNLSFGLDSFSWSDWDPLSYAAEVANRAGLVVVASAGNQGSEALWLLMPAESDGTVAVGATDMRGTAALDDDAVASFSQGAVWDTRQADVAAPGARIVSLRVPNSLLDVRHPYARVGDHLFRGSGTSQAAAIVSGAAALLLSRHPHLTPKQVKTYLAQTAEPVSGDDVRDGYGSIRLDRLIDLPDLHLQLPDDDSSSTAGLDQSRGPDLPMSGAGDLAANGTVWNRGRWAGADWQGSLWEGELWNGGPWGEDLAVTWQDLTWYGPGWSGSRWNGEEWAGSRWNGSRWNGSRWNGSRWNNATWQAADAEDRPWGSAWWG